ncbi:glycosyltransferase [Sphaerisporangium perillae]|uniref:glycosyltransferase n=1 Tax=Sphaerisporangium perillae TaxID=2935860 RepID=UPI00200D3FB7|nr:glycosyltransferase family 2 protein [Sphaerisporangium perillae]
MRDLDYVLPLRWARDDKLEELTAYLRPLSAWARVVVVDGSPPELFERHAKAWADIVASHLRPDGDLDFLNGKVDGVTTGLRHARAERVVIADDDVRYDETGLARVDALLGAADLVRPHNYFRPLPWHARWDTARTLLNRAFGADYPGTFGVRRSTFLAMGGYDGDVLFENLELIRTVRAHGGRECRPADLLVARVPPGVERFWAQRVWQAYDDLAQPARMALFLAVLPVLGVALHRRRYHGVIACAGLVVLLAETGRRRGGGRRVYPFTSALLAPGWVLERAVCSWLALGARLSGRGIPYWGRRIHVAGHSVRRLRRRYDRSARGLRRGQPGR